MEPKAPLTGGGEDPDARPEFFTYRRYLAEFSRMFSNACWGIDYRIARFCVVYSSQRYDAAHPKHAGTACNGATLCQWGWIWGDGSRWSALDR